MSDRNGASGEEDECSEDPGMNFEASGRNTRSELTINTETTQNSVHGWFGEEDRLGLPKRLRMHMNQQIHVAHCPLKRDGLSILCHTWVCVSIEICAKLLLKCFYKGKKLNIRLRKSFYGGKIGNVWIMW